MSPYDILWDIVWEYFKNGTQNPPKSSSQNVKKEETKKEIPVDQFVESSDRIARAIRSWLLTGALGYGLYQGGRVIKKGADTAFTILDATATGGRVAGYVGPLAGLSALIFKWLRS